LIKSLGSSVDPRVPRGLRFLPTLNHSFLKVAALAVALAVLIAFSAETIVQQRYYQDDVAFYSRVIEVTPSDGFAIGMLGNVYLDEGRFDLASNNSRRRSHLSDNQKVTLFLARGLFVAGKYHDAETVLTDCSDSRLNCDGGKRRFSPSPTCKSASEIWTKRNNSFSRWSSATTSSRTSLGLGRALPKTKPAPAGACGISRRI